MFDIAFTDDDSTHSNSLRGKIRLGEFVEAFESSLQFWTRQDYEKQWVNGVRRVVLEHSDSCLISSLTDPENSNFIFWWPIYIDGDKAIFHNQVLFINECQHKFDASQPSRSLHPRETVDEDGNKISEWFVQIADLEEWLQSKRKWRCSP
jgi:hypothetical protein